MLKDKTLRKILKTEDLLEKPELLEKTLKELLSGIKLSEDECMQGDVLVEDVVGELETLVSELEQEGVIRAGEIEILPEEESDEHEESEEDPKEQLRKLLEPCTDEESDEEESEEQEEQEGEEQEEDEREEKRRNLLSDEEDDELTPFQRKQEKLKERIAELESKQLDPKNWTMAGEVTGKQRPYNSLLEEHVEFDQGIGLVAATSRTGPVYDPEVSQNLEDLIRNRIKNRAFDDVELRFEVKRSASKAVELNQEKSTRSLAELYEDEYTRAVNKADNTAQPTMDAKEVELHESIKERFKKICRQLDQLSASASTMHRLYDVEMMGPGAEITVKPLKK